MHPEVNEFFEYSFLSKNYKNILVTGGLGFIGSCLIRRLLKETDLNIFNIDKQKFNNNNLSQEDNLNNLKNKKYTFFKVDISNETELNKIFKSCKPDLIFHLAAESHVDRSIDSPRVFIDSNIIGTFNLLSESLKYYKNISRDRRNFFKFIHISTDEVYGSLGLKGSFNENSCYSPRSPYAASKAASDHLVSSWFHTYGLPTLISNCSNNFGPRQFPDKLIPSTIIKALKKQIIPIYGDGSNVRDWLFVEDHINALLTIAVKGEIGKSYCIGSNNEKSNLEICNDICNLLDKMKPEEYSHNSLIKFVKDRPGHDFRYAINSSKIQKELDWRPIFNYKESIKETVMWYLNNKVWVENIIKRSGYIGERLGVLKNP